MHQTRSGKDGQCDYAFKNSFGGHKNVLLPLKINFVLTNSKDHDEMLLYVAFHLGLHCLPNYIHGIRRRRKGYFENQLTLSAQMVSTF